VMKDYKSKEATSVAEAFEPTQDNIDKRTKRIEIDGIKVALLSKKNRGETVAVNLRFHTGDEKTLFGQRVAATLAGQMLSRGTTRFNREQLKDELEKLKVAGGVNGLSADFQTTRPNVAAAIRMAAHMMRDPAFNEAEFDQLKKLMIASLESQRSDPSAIAAVALSSHFNVVPKGDWRYQPTIDESLQEIQRITLDDVKRFHKTFYGANRGEIAVVGDFDEGDVTKAVTEAFAGWKTSAPYQRLPMPYRDVAAVSRSLETPDKENAVFRARLNVEMNEDDADFPALFLANHIMGGGAGFDSRLTTRIRVKDGLSYGVGSGLSVGQIDRAGSWSVQAIAAPQNVAKVEAAFKDELMKALKDGFTAAEVSAAKSGALQQRLQSRAQDRNVATGWTSNLYLGKTYAWSKQFEDKLMALTPEQVTAALRKYVDPAKITIVKAGDFAKVAKGE
jgi:zinc protease